jgi:hypothetical protein
MAELNSRMKDFYDIWMLSRAYQFHGPTLQDAVMATCQRRATPLSSRALIFSKGFAASSDKQAQWTAFLRKAQIPGISEDFSIIMYEIAEFLYPVAKASENQWRFEKEWLPGGPWQT